MAILDILFGALTPVAIMIAIFGYFAWREHRGSRSKIKQIYADLDARRGVWKNVPR